MDGAVGGVSRVYHIILD